MLTGSNTYRYSTEFMSDFNDSNAKFEFRFSGIVPANTSTGYVMIVAHVEEYINGTWKGSPNSVGTSASLIYNTQKSYDLLAVSNKYTGIISLRAGSLYRFKYYVFNNYLSKSFELYPTCSIIVNID